MSDNEIRCLLFNTLTEAKIGEVSLQAVPRAGDHVVMPPPTRRVWAVLEVWHLASKGTVALLVKERSTGLPQYLRDS